MILPLLKAEAMGLEVQIHNAQTSILRELLFHPLAGFADLQKPTGLNSDHFNFHIKRLVELGLVEKAGRGRYQLTQHGKEYSNKLDTDNNTIERQPKVAVMLAISRQVDNHTVFLFQERLKHPYYGYWGFPTGKMRWGETVLQSAERELLEETGLTATCEYRGVYHEHAYGQEAGELLEDKIFFVVACTNPTGELIERFEGGRNEWMTIAEAQKQPHTFGSFDIEMAVAQGKLAFKEESYRYSKEQF